MTLRHLRLPFFKRDRRRAPRSGEDPVEVFRTFVHVLERMQASRAVASTSSTALSEKG
jgi:hypothetical protein